MPRKLERSFLGHPSAKFFRPFSSEGLFQHPLLLSTVELTAQRRDSEYDPSHDAPMYSDTVLDSGSAASWPLLLSRSSDDLVHRRCSANRSSLRLARVSG